MNTRLRTGGPPRDDTAARAAAQAATARPVPSGPRAYRARIRAVGPFVGLLPPAALGILAWLLLNDSTSLSRGAGGFVSAMFAAPLLPVAGAPMRGAGGGTYVAAAVASLVLWLVIGVVASRRATRSPVATWRNFWTEWAWLAAGTWCGVVIALVASNLVLGRALL